jgi:single-stranded DNA-binding protein
VLVIGRLEIGEWTTREGDPRTSYDIWADDVVNLSPREDGANSSEALDNGYTERAASPAGGGQRSSASPRPAAPEPAADLEDLPF